MPKLTEAIRIANERYTARNVSFKWLRQQTVSHSGRRTTTRTVCYLYRDPLIVACDHAMTRSQMYLDLA
jgi:hypothetical protein